MSKSGTKKLGTWMASLLAVALLSVPLFAETQNRYDSQIQSVVTQKLASKKQFRDVRANVEDGIVTLTGTVDLYQRELDAAKLARKTDHVAGVRDQITVAGPNVPDSQIEQNLAPKLAYERTGFDNTFDYFAIWVKDGVVTLDGAVRNGVAHDQAMADIARMPGVKDVIDNVTLEPASPYDDGLRLRVARAIYRDPALNRYAIDPSRPIRIIVVNGHLTLYGAVDSAMDKQIAGMRAGAVPGAFSVENKLEVATNNQQGM